MRIETKAERLKRRRTKIVATIGPSSSSEETIAALVAAGVDVFRLNMSHGDYTGHRAVYERIRSQADKAGFPVAVLADLGGPKIRVGRFDGGMIELVGGDSVVVTMREVLGRPGLIPSQYEGLANDVKGGDRILVDDGNLELLVERVAGTEITCTVVHGGPLTDRKGINLPGVAVSIPSLTDKDRLDARFALELGVDFLALSFVRRASDVLDLRRIIDQVPRERVPRPAGIVAKIEKPEALDEIDGILAAADGIMVARGDLGVELPPEEVPVAQDQLVDLARARNRPVIVATQMLESMVTNPRPTRAEVADVSHAVAAGADAVMLSAETASGAHPVEAVQMMDRVARQTEAYLWKQGGFGSITAEHVHEKLSVPVLAVESALARATAQLSRDLRVRSIVVLSESGTSAAVVAAARPAAPVIAATTDKSTARRMNLLWGTIPVRVTPEERDESVALARRLPPELGLAESGHFVLLVRGFSADSQKSTPSVTVLAVP